MYLMTASLLNSWKYFLQYGNVEDFKRTLNREETPINKYIERGFAFEKWCMENLEETKKGEYQVAVKKRIDDYLLYGRVDCLKDNIIYDYKYSRRYKVGKFKDNYQTAMYFELVPEATKIVYIITNTDKFSKDNIFYEEYKRNDIQIPILDTVHSFMKWIDDNNYSLNKWIAL